MGAIDTSKRIILFTGSPGVGKTTLVKAGIPPMLSLGGVGFTTGEIREGGRRVGFSISTLDGRRGILAQVNIKGSPRLGRYGINVADIDNLMVGEMQRALGERLPLLVDEFGAMEMYSPKFADLSLQVVAKLPLLVGVIREKHHPICDRLKSMEGVQVIRVAFRNRDMLKGELMGYLKNFGE